MMEQLYRMLVVHPLTAHGEVHRHLLFAGATIRRVTTFQAAEKINPSEFIAPLAMVDGMLDFKPNIYDIRKQDVCAALR